MVFGIVMISPVFAYIGVRGIVIAAAILATLVVVFGAGAMRLRFWFIGIAFAAFALSFLPATYWTDVRYVLSPLFLVFSLFQIQLADERAIDYFITLATALMLVILVGAVTGFVLAFGGVQPLFDIPNPDGRPNYFFFTTFSNSWWGGVIRPSGLYDEPGTLSFMICAIAALRHLGGRSSRVTWIMLALGFVSLSLAHLVYVFFHMLAERLRLRNLAGIVAILVPLILVAGSLGGYEIFEKRLLDRTTITEAGRLVGDNRTERIVNAVEYLADDPKSAMFGAHPSCRFDYNTCKERFPLMGENPLSPLVFQGIFLSWPYYIALAVLFLSPLFGRQYLVSFGIGALLLQRPYLLDVGWALAGCLVVAVTIQTIHARRVRKSSAPIGELPTDTIPGYGASQ